VVDDVLADIDSSGNATTVQREQIEELVEARLALGPFVALAGGVFAIVGGVLVLSWTGRAEDRTRSASAADEASGHPIEDGRERDR